MIVSCAAVGVVATGDPHGKLSDATYLFEHENRPMPAERLIREAIDVCSEQHDDACLADAWWTYGLLFRSNAVIQHEVAYRRDGFLDKTATFDNRYDTAVEYLDRAANAFSAQRRFDRATNAYLNEGYAFELSGHKQKACEAFARSLRAYEQNIAANPNAKPITREGFSDVPQFLASEKKRLGCV